MTTNEGFTPEAHAKLCKALSQAQAEFEQPVKNKAANYGRYADLNECISAVRPALNKHGLFLSQPISVIDGHPELFRICTRIIHEDGAWIDLGEIIVRAEANGRMNSAQAAGSAITYGRRYSLSSALGIVGDDDDDGNASGPNSAAENYSRRPAQKVAQTPKPQAPAQKDAKQVMPPEDYAKMQEIITSWTECKTLEQLKERSDSARMPKLCPSAMEGLRVAYKDIRARLQTA